MVITSLSILYLLYICKITIGSLTYRSNYVLTINQNKDINQLPYISLSSIDRLISLRGGEKYSIFSKIYTFIKNIFRPFFPKSFDETMPRYGTYKSKISNKSKKFSTNISGETTNRLQKEMKSFLENPPDNCQLVVGKNIRSWTIILKGVNGTIYQGEQYKLRMVFPKDYPSKPPSVFFLKPCPKHMHVYTNGDICLNFLGKDWRPTLTAETLVVSILSMLSSAKEKTIPQDNALHADSQPGKQQEGWMYHDDRC